MNLHPLFSSAVVVVLFVVLYLFWFMYQKKALSRIGDLTEQFQLEKGSEGTMHHVLKRISSIVPCQKYAFYLFDESKNRCVLKAIYHTNTDFENIRPSYSGLVSYQKNLYIPKPYLPLQEYEQITLVQEEDAMLLVMPIQGGKGLIKMGPISHVSKKALKQLQQLRVALECALPPFMSAQPAWNEKKGRLASIDHYALYYGYGKTSDLAQFDLAIVEPKSRSSRDLSYLKKVGTTVLAYISVMEIAADDPRFHALKDETFLSLDGQRVKNDEFHTYMLHLGSKEWRTELKRQVDALFQEGYDGLFLDTIGNIENQAFPKVLREQLRHGAIAFLQQIRNNYPGHLLVQNNGIDDLALHSAPYIDAICWENPPLSLPKLREWSSYTVNKLQYLKKTFGIQTLLLLEQNRGGLCELKQVAKKHNFLLYSAPNEYVASVNVQENKNKRVLG